MSQQGNVEVRAIYVIAREIRREWPKPYFGAVPYITAMSDLATVNDTYIAESGKEIVNRFLANAGNWRGEAARRIKAELKAMVK